MAGSDEREVRCGVALLADENVPRPVLARIRSDGWSITAIAEFSPGDTDEQVIVRADQNDWVLVTHDRDFGELAIARQHHVRGVVLLELERLSLASQAERTSAVLAEHRSDLVGFFTVIEPARIRRRPLRSGTEAS
jgi:predicted nuclease of predicted toxin-antitoxin system